MTLIDGKAVSAQIKKEIAAEVADMVARGEKTACEKTKSATFSARPGLR